MVYENIRAVDNIVINSGMTIYNTVDGSTFNGFEYFYTIWQHNKNTKWIILKGSQKYINYLKKFITEKYNFNQECLYNIELYNLKTFIKYKIKNMLFMDYTSINISSNFILKADNYFVLSGSKIKLNRPIVKYFCEYEHIRPFNEQINYKSGIRFDLFKPCLKQENRVFLNINRCKDKLFGSKYIYRSELNHPIPQELYTKVIYIQNPPEIDVKPRIFHESKFFNISYKFIFKGVIDGAYWRYNESKHENINDRLLTSNDALVKEFI